MKNEDKIVELLSEMLQKHDKMIEEQHITNQNVLRMAERLEKLENEQSKTTLAIGELRLSVMTLADKLEAIVDHEKRIVALESKVFH